MAPPLASPSSSSAAAAEGEEHERWSQMLPEMLCDIFRRVEADGGGRWPARRDIVAVACVCRRWRSVVRAAARTPVECGTITFPSSLKMPGPREFPIYCFIKRDKRNSMFFLYLSLTQNFIDGGKLLMAARRFRLGVHTEFIISLSPDDMSEGSSAYLGKLRSDFLGTSFRIYDSKPPYDGAKAASGRLSRHFGSKRISPQVSGGNFEVGQVSYKFNLMKTKGPRRMHCSALCPSAEEPTANPSKTRSHNQVGTTVLRNKAPRWHEHLQCWCLNFHGRVTVASVKNFQLVATSDPTQPWGVGDEEMVLLQFGKVGDNMFTMDYRQPLSAFQAFAISLTSFGTKLACE